MNWFYSSRTLRYSAPACGLGPAGYEGGGGFHTHSHRTHTFWWTHWPLATPNPTTTIEDKSDYPRLHVFAKVCGGVSTMCTRGKTHRMSWITKIWIMHFCFYSPACQTAPMSMDCGCGVRSTLSCSAELAPPYALFAAKTHVDEMFCTNGMNPVRKNIWISIVNIHI